MGSSGATAKPQRNCAALGTNLVVGAAPAEKAGLVITAWRGREKLHYLNAEPIQQIHQRWVSKFTQQRRLARHSFQLEKSIGGRQPCA